eukprot:GHVT01048303.1.p1 GENE.GHVT01048303.1~~GHVT01048303.1.p1  ORF type:complete len:206 (-),score=51.10 GHVT01048303.1:246-863(-)
MPGEHGVGCGCKDEEESVGSRSLLPFIDLAAVRGLNEAVAGTAAGVFKTYDKRLQHAPVLTSADGDPELLVQVPFISPCSVCSLAVIGGDDGRAPKRVRIFANRDDLDFSNVEEGVPVQSLDLAVDFHGAINYPLKVSRLQSVTSLWLHFPEPVEGDTIEIFYIGLRGVGSNLQRQPVVTVYEAQGNRSDHAVPDDERNFFNFGV